MNNITEILKHRKICKSVWFMRQAGRYLPEFRRIRSQYQNFIDLCLNAELSSEITLQPVKRFNLDSAIIFSDILIVPHALNQKVEFVKNRGPVLEEFNSKKFLNNNNTSFTKKLYPVYKAIQKTRKRLDKNKSLIGFIGAPWTLLVYMLGAKESNKKVDYKKIKTKKFEVNLILNKLNDYLCTHIENQVDAGADAIQIFDSWAGFILPEDLQKYCYIPNLKIVNFCKEKKIPVMCYPKGLNTNYREFNNVVKPDAISLDYDVDPLWVKQNLIGVVLQGGLDPKLLLSPEKEMLDGAKKYLDTFKDLPYIFNLGHGLLPETDPDMVSKLIKFYREY